jgi:hypothetical protein
VTSRLGDIDIIENLKSVIDLVNDNLFEVPVRVAKFNVPFAVGSQLQPLEGPSLKAQFLSGRIKLWAKAWFLFFTAKWEKTVFSWDGIPHEWHVGELLLSVDPEKVKALKHDIDMLVAPNMVLLPSLSLLPVPGTADPAATSHAIDQAFDTQVIAAPIPYDAHLEAELGKPWILSSSPNGRCATIIRK